MHQVSVIVNQSSSVLKHLHIILVHILIRSRNKISHASPTLHTRETTCEFLNKCVSTITYILAPVMLDLISYWD